MASNQPSWTSFRGTPQSRGIKRAPAQRYLGLCYQTGQGVATGLLRGVKWLRRAAEQTTPRRNVIWGSVTRRAWGCRRIRLGGEMVSRGCRAGDPAAQFKPGCVRNRPGRDAKLRRSRSSGITPRRKQGEAQAQFNLGFFTRPARWCRRILPRRPVGTWRRRNRRSPRPVQSRLCYQTGRACPKATPRRENGSAAPPSRVTRRPNTNLGLYYSTLETATPAEAEGEEPNRRMNPPPPSIPDSSAGIK